MAEEILGDLSVQITGDFSELSSAIDQATSEATQGAQDIAAAFDASGDSGLAQSFTDIGSAASSASDGLESFAQAASASFGETQSVEDAAAALDIALSGVGDAAGSASGGLSDFSDSETEVASSSEEAEGGIAGMAEQFVALAEALAVTEGLKEFGQEALTAYGTVQSVTIGLTQLTGSAEQADQIIEQVKELAATEPFAFPEIAPTIQKMVALGVAADAIPGVMQHVADAAAATGNSFQQVANSFDRMTLSGTAGARQLTQLGISASQLADAMGVTAAQVTVAFKALDQSQRIQVLEDAMTKFAGSAIAQAQGIAGQWQIFQNAFEEVMVNVGEALAPVIGDILSFGKVILGAIQSAVAVFNQLPEPVKDVAVALGLVVAAIVPLAAAVSAMGFAWIGLQAAGEALTGIMGALGIATGEVAASETVATVASGELATSEEAAAVATGELEVSVGAAGIALGALAVVIGAVVGWDLGKWFVQATQSATPFETQALSIGGTLNELDQGVGLTADQLKDLDAALSTVDWTQFNTGATAASGAVKDVTDKLGQLIQPLTAITKAQMDANSAAGQATLAFQLAKLAVQNAQQAYDAGTGSAASLTLAHQVLARAATDLDTALQKETVHGKDWADSVAGITDAMNKAQEKFTSLLSIFTNLSAAADGSTQSNQALATVYGKLESAAKSAGDAFASYQGILAQVNDTVAQNYQNFQQLGAAYGTLLNEQRSGIDVTAQLADIYSKWQAAGKAVGESIATISGVMATLTQNAQGQETALLSVAGAFQKLGAIAAPTADQTIALGAAFKQITSDAQAMGIQVNTAGGTIQFTANAGTQASPALQTYIDRLNSIFTSGQQVVDINGKVTTTTGQVTGAMNPLAQAILAAYQATQQATGATTAHTAALNTNADAAARAKQAQIDLGSTYETVNNTILNLTNTGKNQITNLENMVSAFVALDSQTQTTVAGQVALQDAFKNAQAAGAALGITITQTGASAANNATPAVQALAQQINNAIQQMNGGSNAGVNFAGVLKNVGTAASQAASEINALAGDVSSFQNILSGSIGAGTAGGTLMGGIGGPGSSVFSAGGTGAYGGIGGSQAFVIPLPKDPSPGTDYWDGTAWVAIPTNAASYDPLKSGSNSSYSGVAATSTLGTAAAVTALGTAATTATGAITPLGNAAVTAATNGVTPLGNAAVTAASSLTGTGSLGAAVSNVLPIFETYAQQLGTASVSLAQVEQNTGSLSAEQQKYYQAVVDSENAQDAYTNAVNSGTASQSQLLSLYEASTAAQQAVQGLTGTAQVAGDQVGFLGDQVASTTVSAADLETGMSGLTTQQQNYYAAAAASINAQNAYTNAVNAGTDSVAQLTALLEASTAAQQKVQGLTGGASSGNPDVTTTTGGGPTTPAPPEPPTGETWSTGQWDWDQATSQWVWGAPPQRGGQVGSSSNFPGATSAYQPSLLNPLTGAALTGTGGLGAYTTPPINLTVNLNAGTVVGQNAAKQLTDMVAPQLVAQLRQAGVKI